MKDLSSIKNLQRQSIKAAFVIAFLASQWLSVSAEILSTATIGGVEVDIRRPSEGAYPLIIFSHGMGACPDDYSDIQKRLVNAGYVIIAPKHSDCVSGLTQPEIPWREAQNWTEQTHAYRRDDIHHLLNELPSSTYEQYIESFNRVGCVGHSLGGYTCMGLAGAWDSWKRNEITAIALLSPWHKPFIEQQRMAHMNNVKTLYQGGSIDRPISMDLMRAGGTFDQTNPSKYMQIFRRARHSSWADGRLAKRFHEQMAYYLVAFFDSSLNDVENTKLALKKSQITDLRFEH